MAGPNYDRRLHANRLHSIPWDGKDGPKNVYSRDDILQDRTPTALAANQPMSVEGETKHDPNTWPKIWPKAGRVLNVPKVVVLSSLPYWTLLWEGTTFIGPRDVIGVSLLDPTLFGNYYYFEQWDNPTNFDERYHREVGSGINYLQQEHRKILESFKAVKEALESDPNDPIQVILPNWVNATLVQRGNGDLTINHETLNAAHGGTVNKRACDVADATPCFIETPHPWGVMYPDINSPANRIPFNCPTVPFLHCPEPGFGTNVLHLYIGHTVINPFNSNSIFDTQAWSLSPEVQWFGTFPITDYLGSPILNRAGARPVWRDLGYNYGTGLSYDAYYAGAAETLKKNSLKYRNYAIHLTTYNHVPDIAWSIHNIWSDQNRKCPATQFYFSTETFDEFAEGYDTEDQLIIDCANSGANPAHIKYGETQNNFPDSPSLRIAESRFYPPIMKRVDDYYRSIEENQKNALKKVIIDFALEEMVKYADVEQLNAKMTNRDLLIDYIREHFANNP